MLNKLLTTDLIGVWVTKLIESIEKTNGIKGNRAFWKKK